MPHLLRTSLRLLAVMLPLTLGACADTLTARDSASSATLRRDYDKTLTKAEQKAVIDDMTMAISKQYPLLSHWTGGGGAPAGAAART